MPKNKRKKIEYIPYRSAFFIFEELEEQILKTFKRKKYIPASYRAIQEEWDIKETISPNHLIKWMHMKRFTVFASDDLIGILNNRKVPSSEKMDFGHEGSKIKEVELHYPNFRP